MKVVLRFSILLAVLATVNANAAPEISYSMANVAVPENKVPLKFKSMHVWRATDKPYYKALSNTFHRKGNFLEVTVSGIPSFGTNYTPEVNGRWITSRNSAIRTISVSIMSPNQEELEFYECEKTVNYSIRYKTSDPGGAGAISPTMKHASAIAGNQCMLEIQEKLLADLDQIEEWNTQFVPGYGE